MLARLAQRLRPVVQPLRLGPPRDRVVLDPRVDPHPSLVDVGLDVFQGQIEPHVPVELAVGRVAGVALTGRPDRIGGLRVATEGRHPVRAVDRGVDPGPRPGLRQQDAVRVQEEVPEMMGRQVLFQPRRVTAFGQPEAARRQVEKPLVLLDGQLHLGVDHLGLDLQRQETVGGAGRDQLQGAPRLQGLETGQEVGGVTNGKILSGPLEPLQVHARQGCQLLLPAGALHLAAGQLDEPVQVLEITLPQQPVLEHGRQRGGDGNRQAEGHPVPQQPLENAQKRQIGLGDGLEEPVLLQEPFAVGVRTKGRWQCSTRER